MKICFLIGSPEISGGTYVIFEHALYLQNCGHDVSIVAIWQPDQSRPAWHPAVNELKFLTLEAAKSQSFDLAIATWWRTLYDLAPQINAQRFCYFVQSIESWFYPDSDVAVRNLANSTYLLDIPGITEAHWIKDHLSTKFGHSYFIAPNGCRKDIFNTDGTLLLPKKPGELRVLVEGPLGVDFKNVERTIELVQSSKADEIILLTSSEIASYPGVAHVFSKVPTTKCGEIYRSCDVLVKLSTIEGMFGPPLEMFHCGGTAVVYAVTGFDEYIVNNENALVLPLHDEAGVVAAINRLKDDPALLARLRSNAMTTAASWPDWNAASPVFAKAVLDILSEPPTDTTKMKLMIAEFHAQFRRVDGAYSNQAQRRLGGVVAAVSTRFPKLTRVVKGIKLRYRRSRTIQSRTQI